MTMPGMNLSDFVNTINERYSGLAQVYFFNTAGEITGVRDIELVSGKKNLDKELGCTGIEILAGVRKLSYVESKYFQTHDWKGVAAFSRIPALDWSIAAIHRFTIKDTLQTGITLLFAVMMVIIFSMTLMVMIPAISVLKRLRMLSHSV
jgi:hypothetical protein